MNSLMLADKTSIDTANKDSAAGIIGDNDLKDQIHHMVIQAKNEKIT
jgi:hypothetical protein